MYENFLAPRKSFQE